MKSKEDMTTSNETPKNPLLGLIQLVVATIAIGYAVYVLVTL